MDSGGSSSHRLGAVSQEGQRRNRRSKRRAALVFTGNSVPIRMVAGWLRHCGFSSFSSCET